MQVYELCYLILPSIPEEGIAGVVSEIKALVEKAGGREFDGESPFKIDLAYAMSKTVGASRYVVSDAYIGWMKFDLEPESVKAVNDELAKIDELLRFLVVKAPRETIFTFAEAKAKLVAESVDDKEAKEGVAPVVE